MDGKILVAHRNEMVLDVIRDMLQNVGFATTLTTDGHQALAKALSERYNLIIVDRNLPGALDGVRLAERLRKYGVRAPIIAARAEVTESTTASSCLANPFTVSTRFGIRSARLCSTLSTWAHAARMASCCATRSLRTPTSLPPATKPTSSSTPSTIASTFI